jgi:hypothetical protein
MIVESVILQKEKCFMRSSEGELLQDHGRDKGIELCEPEENPLLDQGQVVGTKTCHAQI